MTATVETLLPADGTWIQLSTGSASVTVQLMSEGPIRTQVNQSAPAVESQTGFLMDEDNDTVFSANQLVGLDNCYARSVSGRAERITVMRA